MGDVGCGMKKNKTKQNKKNRKSQDMEDSPRTLTSWDRLKNILRGARWRDCPKNSDGMHYFGCSFYCCLSDLNSLSFILP